MILDGRTQQGGQMRIIPVLAILILKCKKDCHEGMIFSSLIFIIQRDSATRFFTSGFFNESVSPKPLSIPSGPLCRTVSKTHRDITAAQGAPPVSLSDTLLHLQISQLKVHYRCR
jgi:hypothetical protein